MDNRFKQLGLDELRAIRRESRMYYWAVAVLSFFYEFADADGALVYVASVLSRSGQPIRGDIDRPDLAGYFPVRNDGAS